jgi:hypothetical protein
VSSPSLWRWHNVMCISLDADRLLRPSTSFSYAASEAHLSTCSSDAWQSALPQQPLYDDAPHC